MALFRRLKRFRETFCGRCLKAADYISCLKDDTPAIDVPDVRPELYAGFENRQRTVQGEGVG